LVKTRQQFDERGLAGTVLPYQREAGPRDQMQVDVLERRLLRLRIGKADILETDPILGMGPFDGVAAGLRHLSLQIFVQGRQVEIVLVHPAYRRKNGRDGGLALSEQRHVHGHLAECYDAPYGTHRDPGIRRVQSQGADEPKAKAPRVASDGERAILLVEPAENIPVPLEQAGSK